MLTSFILEVASPVVICTLLALPVLGDIEWSEALHLFMMYCGVMWFALGLASVIPWAINGRGPGPLRTSLWDVTEVNRSATIADAPGSSARLSKRKATYTGGRIQSMPPLRLNPAPGFPSRGTDEAVQASFPVVPVQFAPRHLFSQN